MKKLEYEDLKMGMRVTDMEGFTGSVVLFKQIHNVHVVFDNGGSSPE